MQSPKTTKQPRPKRRTVLQVIPNLGAGGAEQTCVDVTAALVKAGHRAIVISNGGPRVIDIQRAGGEHIQMPVHSKNPLTMWINSLRIQKLIERELIDVVHARSRAPAWSCHWACENSFAHFMTTCHAPYNIGDSDWKRKYNAVIAKGELVIANSEYVAKYLTQNYDIKPDRIRIIPRGIPLEKFSPSLASTERMMRLSDLWRVPEVATIILMPGRLTRWKGQAVMIEAMAKLKRDDVYCVLLGDDQGRNEYREELEQLAVDLNVHERVRIAGHCDDMATAYMLANVVVSASIEPEGFGRVAVEAMAMGRPLIATDIGGSKETVVQNVTGWLVPPADPDALCEGLKFVLSLTPDELRIVARDARDRVEALFSKDKMVASTLAVYEELCSK